MERVWSVRGQGGGARGRGVRGVREEGCGDGGEGQEEGGAEVGAEAGEEADGGGEGDGLFDVEVEAVERVALEEGAEGGVVGFELRGVV